MLRRAHPTALSVAVLTLLASAAVSQEKNGDPDPPNSPNVAARAALRSGQPHAAAEILKKVNLATLTEEGRRRWRLLARDAAVRTGDRAWLEAVNQVPDRVAFADGYVIFTAASYLRAADFQAARRFVNLIRDPQHLNEREKRRLMATHLRLEQLEGNRKAERERATELLAYGSRWPTATCQSCHADPKQPGKLTHLNLADWWVGQRYEEILRRDGDAARVERDARAELARRPTDDAARVRLAFALRAQGRAEEAREVFASLPWTEAPGREVVKPIDILIFP